MTVKLSPLIRRFFSFFMIFLMLVYAVSCAYFKTKPASVSDLKSILDLGKVQKYFVLHSNKNVYTFKDLTITEEMLSGNLAKDTDRTIYYYSPDRPKQVDAGEKGIYHEVHIYSNQDYTIGQVNIPVTDINEIKIIRPDTGKTIGFIVVSTAGVLAILLAIIAALKSSCPYIYVHDGEDFVFEGEIFGGAILQNLERDDYMPLPDIKENQNLYKIRISNELKEEQFTNLARLMTINHPKNTSVLLDQKGHAWLIGTLEKPASAFSNGRSNLLSLVEEKERKVFLFDDEDADQNEIFLTFDKPESAPNAQLVINAQNTFWFDWLFGEFTKKMGSFYDTWMDIQRESTTEERLQKINAIGFPLSIYAKYDEQWQLIERLPTVGPMASRDFVIPISLENHTGNEIEIKIETGFMFWEMDYAAMSFTAQEDLQVLEFNPLRAISQDGLDFKATLSNDDDQYLEQLSIGEVVEIHYPTPKAKEHEIQTVFLHTKGYYYPVREYTGFPNMKELLKFKDPSYFDEFSKNEFRRVMARERSVLADD